MDNVADQLHNLLFGVRRSIRYHLRRRAWFERLDMTANAVAVILGSATVAGALGKYDEKFVALAGVLVTITASLNLVFGCGNKARLHSDLARRFINLERRIVVSQSPKDSDLKDWISERLQIEYDEPPALVILDALCHNDVMRAMGYERDKMIKVRWWQRAMSHIIDLQQESLSNP